MTSVKTSPDQLVPTNMAIPAEWQAELDQYRPGTPEYLEFVTALGELGLSGVEVEENDLGEPPNGFVSWNRVAGGSRLAASQFDEKIIGLATGPEEIAVDTVELVTDAGQTVRVCDLRSSMSSQIQKLGPHSPREQTKLDNSFYRDVKIFAETGRAQRSVTGITHGIYYTRAGNTSMRTYWTSAVDKNNVDGVRTLARLADSGDNKGQESRLYQRLFGSSL